MYRELLAELSKGYGWVRPQPPAPKRKSPQPKKPWAAPFRRSFAPFSGS